jgi:hypothetical protein
MTSDYLKQYWRKIIEERATYEHPGYTISDWKRDVLAGKTRRGYADLVSDQLASTRTPLPPELRQFRPRTTAGKSVQRVAIEEFNEVGFCRMAQANGRGWFCMRRAFENLIPFIVAKDEHTFIVCKATAENRIYLRTSAAEKIYEWDGVAVPRYEEM